MELELLEKKVESIENYLKKFEQVIETVAKEKAAEEVSVVRDQALFDKGMAFYKGTDYVQAEEIFFKVVEKAPNWDGALFHLASSCYCLKKYEDAVKYYKKAVFFNPNWIEANFWLARTFYDWGKFGEAIAPFKRTIELSPNHKDAHFFLGYSYYAERKFVDAKDCFFKCLDIDEKWEQAYYWLGKTYFSMQHYEKAIETFERGLKINPNNRDFAVGYFDVVEEKRNKCDWRNLDKEIKRLLEISDYFVSIGETSPIAVHSSLSMIMDAEAQFKIAKSYSLGLEKRYAGLGKDINFVFSERKKKKRMRIGYLSGCFGNHSVGSVVKNLFRYHDRSKYEISVYSYCGEDNSENLKCIKNNAEHFIDITSLSIEDSAKKIFQDDIDILLDLNIHLGCLTPANYKSKMELALIRLAPVQINFLSLPGTCGAKNIDYFITDKIANNLEDEKYFSEKFIFLPDSFFPADSGNNFIDFKKINREGFLRNNFVFCSFNNRYKIEPDIFSVWMRILKEVPNSVLWLYASDFMVRENIKKEAALRNISDERIIFKTQANSQTDYLNEYIKADIFLDSYYYNGHSTSYHALMGGCPVLTIKGNTFARRVSASQLNALGLTNELVCSNFAEYEKKAIYLGNHPEEVKKIKEKLSVNKKTYPLFDTPKYVKNMEKAFDRVWENYLAGNKPQHIMV